MLSDCCLPACLYLSIDRARRSVRDIFSKPLIYLDQGLRLGHAPTQRPLPPPKYMDFMQLRRRAKCLPFVFSKLSRRSPACFSHALCACVAYDICQTMRTWQAGQWLHAGTKRWPERRRSIDMCAGVNAVLAFRPGSRRGISPPPDIMRLSHSQRRGAIPAHDSKS